jgi:hypothetical protein
MTAPDLTAIIDDVEKAIWIANREPGATGRDMARFAVTATLLALTPMVDNWVALAKDNASIGARFEMRADDAEADLDYLTATARSADARVAYTAGNTLLSCASTLRSLIEGAK